MNPTYDESLQATTAGLRASGYQVLGIRCDVSDERQVSAMVEQTVASYGRLDMAFDNAGIQAPPSDAADEPAEPSTASTPSTCAESGRA